MQKFLEFIKTKLNIDGFVQNSSNLDKTKDELKEMMKFEIDKNGNKCSLNHIDTSKIINMNYLFRHTKFNGDISKWDVSKVLDMKCMFLHSDFDEDVSKWNIKTKCDTLNMFYGCPIKNEYKPKKLKDK